MRVGIFGERDRRGMWGRLELEVARRDRADCDRLEEDRMMDGPGEGEGDGELWTGETIFEGE